MQQFLRMRLLDNGLHNMIGFKRRMVRKLLRICSSVDTLDCVQMLEIYEESLDKERREAYRQFDPPEGLALAQVDFLDYLRREYFFVPGAVYALWEAEGMYVSALRLEPYRDGLLIAGLETRVHSRGRGYAHALLKAVMAYCSKQGNRCLYSHIANRNRISIRLHETCGFKKILSCANFLDGSISQNYGTWIWYSH